MLSSQRLFQVKPSTFHLSPRVSNLTLLPRRQYTTETIDYGVEKKSRSLLDVFSKKVHSLDPELVKILRCPITHKPLRYDAKADELIVDEDGIVYHVVDGVPILMPSAAKSLYRYVESENPK